MRLLLDQRNQSTEVPAQAHVLRLTTVYKHNLFRLTILKTDRNYDDGAARKVMLEIFQLLGNTGPLVSAYRGQLANILN